jgi:hypothetical protein
MASLSPGTASLGRRGSPFVDDGLGGIVEVIAELVGPRRCSAALFWTWTVLKNANSNGILWYFNVT